MGGSATIEIATPRDWFGDPRLGTFTLYIDGTRAGKLPPRGRLTATCNAGKHVVRARHWWYLSPRLDVEVAAEAVLHVQVDVVRVGSLPARMLRLMFTPWRGLTVATTDG